MPHSVFADMNFRNAGFFQAWCQCHVHCEECGRIGALLLRDRTFVCQECLERTNF